MALRVAVLAVVCRVYALVCQLRVAAYVLRHVVGNLGVLEQIFVHEDVRLRSGLAAVAAFLSWNFLFRGAVVLGHVVRYVVGVVVAAILIGSVVGRAAGEGDVERHGIVVGCVVGILVFLLVRVNGGEAADGRSLVDEPASGLQPAEPCRQRAVALSRAGGRSVAKVLELAAVVGPVAGSAVLVVLASAAVTVAQGRQSVDVEPVAIGGVGRHLELVVALRGGEADAVAQHPVALHRLFHVEAVVHPVLERRAVNHVRAFGMVVLVEALVGVERRDAVCQHVRAGGFAALLRPSYLKAVAVALVLSALQGPAVVYEHGENGVVHVPGVVGVLPRAASVELVAGAGEELDGEAVGVASVAPLVDVVVRVAVDDDVVPAVKELLVACVLAVVALAEALLQAGVAVVVEHAPLNHAEAALQLHAVVGGVANLQSAVVPVVGADVVHDSARSLGYVLVVAVLSAEVEHGLLVAVGEHADARVLGSGGVHRDLFIQVVRTSAHPQDVAGLQCRESLHRVAHRPVD